MEATTDRAEPEGVEVSETGAGKFQVRVSSASGVFVADEPVSAGGLGSGPTPYDLLGAALGACTVMTLRLYADRKGWPLKSSFVRVLHRSDGLDAKDRFAREIVLEGELSEEQRRRLLEIANRCPVDRTLERGSDVVTVLMTQPPRERLCSEPLEHALAMAEAGED
jgi:putative redox protein